ncbi:hypothetical protein ACSQ67_015847 [Phaseolus vulgaris]
MAKKNLKKTRGRQKIEIKKMSNEHNLRVTFSKRRTGIFKKASELATLCGVDIAVIMFSPSSQDVEEHSWWAIPMENMNDSQLEKCKKMLEDLKERVNEKREKLLLQSTFSYNSQTQFFTGGNSFSSVNNTETIHPPLSL